MSTDSETASRRDAAEQGAGVGARVSAGRRLLKGSATYGLGSIAQKGIGFALIPVYTRFLTPSDYGIVAVTTAVGTVFTILFGLGLHGAVTRQYYDYGEAKSELGEYLGTVYSFFVVAGLAMLGGLLLVGDTAFSRLLKSIPFDPYIKLTLWGSLFLAYSPMLLSLYRAREQAGRYVALSLLQTLLSLGGVVYFVVVLQRGALGKVQGQLWGAAILILVVAVLAAREVRPAFSTVKLKVALRFALPLLPHLLFAWVFSAADRILLERMTSLQEVGVYNLGYQLGMIISVLVGAINNAWTPIFYDTAKNRTDAPEVISRVWSIYVVGLVAISSVLILLSREIVTVVADPAYHEAYRVVPIVASAYVLQGLYFMSVTQMFYIGRTGVLPLLTGSAGVVNLALNFLLIPVLGLMGAALATLGSFAVLAVLTHVVGQRSYRIPYSYGPAGGALVVLSLIVAFAYWAHALPYALDLGTRVILALAFGAVGLFLLRGDRSRLHRWLAI